MVSSTLQEVLATTGRTMRMIWISLVVSTLFFVVVAFLRTPAHTGGLSAIVQQSLIGLAVCIGAASLLYRRARLSDKAVAAGLFLEEANSAGSNTMLEGLSAAERRVFGAILHILSPLIICLALNEAVALIGIALAMLSGQPKSVLPFAAASVILSALVYPNIERRGEQLW